MKYLLKLSKLCPKPISSISRSSSSSSSLSQKTLLLNSYENQKSKCYSLDPGEYKINPKGVFSNNEINLKEIQVYGFDYDYTLAYYNVSLYRLLFNLARDYLVEHYKYPSGLKNLEYLPHFPIRGLHLDIKKGWLMKIDSYHNIQMGTVYHGMNEISTNDVLKHYGGRRFNMEDIGYTQSSPNFHHYVDLFCLPEICLLACTFQYFLDRGIHFTPEYIFQDVDEAVNAIHRNQLLHRSITQSIDDYLLPLVDEANPLADLSYHLKEFLTRLNKSGKNVFLITNSPYWFVNFGMQSLCGSDWTSLFDIIICNSRKPQFFTSKSKPFRRFNVKTNSKSWEKVDKLNKCDIYYEGNLFEMLERTGWQSNKVLYFGDHIYGDLAQPFLKFGIRTAAIINEVEQEVRIINNIDYQRNVAWQNSLEDLIEKLMFLKEEDPNLGDSSPNTPSIQEIRNAWLEERNCLREKSKIAFNPYFGSVFRANNNPSFFLVV